MKPTMNNIADRGAELLRRLEDANVLLIEWEHTLSIRLGVPLVHDGVSWPKRRGPFSNMLFLY